jgi:uncharacterized membrane protein
MGGVLKMGEQPQASSDDRLWAALGYPIPVIALVLLLMEEKRDVYFLKYHAIQSVILNVVLWIVLVPVSILTLGCGSVLWLVTLWPAYDSYQGNLTELPLIADFMKKQGWA